MVRGVPLTASAEGKEEAEAKCAPFVPHPILLMLHFSKRGPRASGVPPTRPRALGSVGVLSDSGTQGTRRGTRGWRGPPLCGGRSRLHH